MLAEVHPIADRKLGRKGSGGQKPASAAEKAEETCVQFQQLLASVMAGLHGQSFMAAEKNIASQLRILGVLLLELFLIVCEANLAKTLERRMTYGNRTFQRRPAKGRSYSCLFGVLQYSRTYMHSVDAIGDGGRQGFFPLDAKLGICAERVSMSLASLATRIATKISFTETALTLKLFLGHSPSTEVIERAVLGLGRQAVDFQQSPPLVENDGDVLVIQIDGKAAPQATDSELEKRRGKRRKRKLERSARHRGRADRKRNGSKVRRAKGDKSKNGKVAHVVVVYSLKRVGKRLEGPINKRVFASFCPKRAAFETARKEVLRRGFGPTSGKTVQLVTDGDRDLARLGAEYLPQAQHTIDVMHVVEYMWKAGHVLFGEGSKETSRWVEARKKDIYGGNISSVIRELTRKINIQGPHARGRERRSKLDKIRSYIEKRKANMNYAELQEQDLELASGIAEGAVNYVIGRRFDQGGMRWVKGRAEALLQLRCIEINGDWDTFIGRVHSALQAKAWREGESPKLLSYEPLGLELESRAA